MTRDQTAAVADEVLAYGSALGFLLSKLGKRWILGTGFCHRSVVQEAVRLGIADARYGDCRWGVRISPLGILVRDFLREGEGNG